MGRGRAPCCDKTKVRTGPWSPAEDLRLMNFIKNNGHNNWRALPKQAGLLRCGKSCRLRWINYLRPDVKRGNFTPEEESTIIQLHASFGNKWSKIASCLPGRTDNEIKNVWNTHLKKRLNKSDHKKGDDDETTMELEELVEKSNSPILSSSSPQLSNSDVATTSEFDGDFWELLDSLEPLHPNKTSHDQLRVDDTNLSSINVDEGKVEVEVEVGRWLRFLETELGLANDADYLPEIPKCQDIIQPTSSPTHRYLGI